MKQTSSTVMPGTSDEAPRLTQADFDRAKFKVSGQEASKSEWQSAVRTKTGKQRINIMLAKNTRIVRAASASKTTPEYAPRAR